MNNMNHIHNFESNTYYNYYITSISSLWQILEIVILNESPPPRAHPQSVLTLFSPSQAQLQQASNGIIIPPYIWTVSFPKD